MLMIDSENSMSILLTTYIVCLNIIFDINTITIFQEYQINFYNYSTI